MGADRFHVRPVQRRHWALLPPWVRARPHLIHRPVPEAPTVPEAPQVIRGTAPGRGRQPWGKASSPQRPGAVQNGTSPAEPWSSGCWGMDRQWGGHVATGHARSCPVGGRPGLQPMSSLAQITKIVHRHAQLGSPFSGTRPGRLILVLSMLQMGTRRPKDRRWPLRAYMAAQGRDQVWSWPCCRSGLLIRALGCT